MERDGEGDQRPDPAVAPLLCPQREWLGGLLRQRRRSGEGVVHPAMSRPLILSVALPSDTGCVLSIQSHTVQVVRSRCLGREHLLYPGLRHALVLQGHVGNKSAIFPVHLLSFDVDPIISVQFSNYTGYPTFRGQVLNGCQLWDLIEVLEENDLLHNTHLLTGYIDSVSFLNTVVQVVDKLRSVNPNLIDGIPFNVARNLYFRKAFTYASNYNLGGYAPPSYNKLRTTLVQEKTHVEQMLQSIKSTWNSKCKMDQCF